MVEQFCPSDFFNSNILPFKDDEFDFQSTLKDLGCLKSSELDLLKEDLLYRRFIENFGFGKNILEIYDHWIDVILPKQVASRHLTLPAPTGGTIVFQNLQCEKRTTNNVNPLTPQICREKGYSYSLNIYVDAVYIPSTDSNDLKNNINKGAKLIEKKIPIGKIPLMLGSKHCYLYGKNYQNILKLKEDATDPLGYFIIKGTERTVIIQEALRVSNWFINVNSKGIVECRITCVIPTGTTLVVVSVEKEIQQLQVRLHHSGSKPYPIFIIFYFLGIGLAEAQQMIIQFIPKENVKKVLYGLQSSIVEANTYYSNPVKILMKEFENYLGAKITEEEAKKQFTQKIHDDLFSNIKSSKDKATHLAFTASIVIRQILGLRNFDDRDHWGNKRLETAARSMERLFNGLYGRMIDMAQDSINNKRYTSISVVRNVLLHNKLTEDFETSFNANSWGVPTYSAFGKIMTSYRKENITDTLKREGIVSIHSQNGRINSPAPRKAKLQALRMVHGSQAGFVCIAETPEGEGCGLVKNLTLTVHISLEREISAICNFIGENDDIRILISENKTEEHQYPFSINGEITGWSSLVLLDKLIKGRRTGVLPIDSCICFNKTDQIIEFYCDSGRPTRPLLIVGESGKLVVDELEAWEDDIGSLLKKGAIEFIDAREQDNAYISETIFDFRNEYEHFQETIHFKEQLVRSRILEISNNVYNIIKKYNGTYNTAENLKVLMSVLDKNLLNIYQNLLKEEEKYLKLDKPFVDYKNKHFELTFKYPELDTLEKVENAIDDFEAFIEKNKNALESDLDELLKYYQHLLPEIEILSKLSAISFIKNKLDELIDIESVKNKDIIEILQKIPEDVSNIKKITAVSKMYQNLDLFNLIDVSSEIFEHFENLIREIDIDFEIETLSKRQTFTHCELDPLSIFGIAGGIIPKPNHEQGPRVTYQASMAKQATGSYHMLHHLRYDKAFKVLVNTSRTGFETTIYDPAGLNIVPTGQTPILAMYALPENMEDAIVVKQEYLDAGNLDIIKYVTHKSIQKEDTEKFARPKSKEGEIEGRYAAIDDNGLPRLGAYIRQNDCVIGKQREIIFKDGSPSKIENISEYAGVGESGYVDRVLVTNNVSGGQIVRVKIRQYRRQISGDKVAARYSQKGTIANIRPSSELPRIIGGVNDGVVPDFYVNPLSQPSRMTLGMILEILLTKAALYTGEKVDASAFKFIDINYFKNVLLKYGLDPSGDEKMQHPDGTLIDVPVFVGPCYYQCLRHHVLDKIQMRGKGQLKPLTHQPIRGRSNEGGLRFGEMERDGIISHGAAYTLQERLMVVSDEYRTTYCITCGNLAIYDLNKEKAICRICGIDKARFGTVRYPFIFKLIINILNTFNMGIKFDLIPEIGLGVRPEERLLG